MKATISITHGHLICPAQGIDEPMDLHIADGRILALGDAPADFVAERVIDAREQVICPGLIDLSAKLREPGYEQKGTIASETAAAAASGITTLVCPPDTDPVVDTPALIELIRRKAKASGKARVLCVGALTQDLAGEQLAEMAALMENPDCVAVGNAGRPLVNTLVERRALEYAATFGIRVLLHPEDRHLKAGGYVHEGAVAARLGLPGIPSAAETVAVARDLALAEHTGANIHFRGLSTGKAVRMLREAQLSQAVSADVAIHQLWLTEQDIDGFDAACHVDPPFRTQQDREELRAGVRDGVISVICSDHQPHEDDAKDAPFPQTQPGISGLESLLPLTLRLVEEGILDRATAIARLTLGPASVLGFQSGTLQPGSLADVCVFDPEGIWVLDPLRMRSEGWNTPFAGWEMRGRVTHTLFEGRVVFDLAESRG